MPSVVATAVTAWLLPVDLEAGGSAVEHPQSPGGGRLSEGPVQDPAVDSTCGRVEQGASDGSERREGAGRLHWFDLLDDDRENGLR